LTEHVKKGQLIPKRETRRSFGGFPEERERKKKKKEEGRKREIDMGKRRRRGGGLCLNHAICQPSVARLRVEGGGEMGGLEPIWRICTQLA